MTDEVVECLNKDQKTKMKKKFKNYNISQLTSYLKRENN